MSSGNLGAPVQIHKTPERKARDAKRRRRQEERWAKRCGPVSVSFICPACGGPHHRRDCPEGAL